MPSLGTALSCFTQMSGCTESLLEVGGGCEAAVGEAVSYS